MKDTAVHRTKGLRPALTCMATLGFDRQACLAGTGIDPEQLELAGYGISLEQEFAFYRGLLALTNNPLIGTALGTHYRVESYGVFGYALLSAQTVGEVMYLAAEFGSTLAYSHFKIDFQVCDGQARLSMSEQAPVPPDLLQLYGDRDLSAVMSGAKLALERAIPLSQVALMHDDEDHRKQYEQFFQCPVVFAQDRMQLCFDSAWLELPMPLRDMDTSAYCRAQCQHLLQQFKQNTSLVDEVRSALLQSPPEFLSLDETANLLGMSQRTLRRKLSAEGWQFRDILTEVRQQLAKEFLLSDLPVQRIADMLGYSEAANFSHAFKQWTGLSPRAFRQTKANSE